MAEFEIVDKLPEHLSRVRNWKAIRCALIALPDGKALRLPLDTFGKDQMSSHLRFCGDRKLRYRTLPDGIYAWLEGEK